MDTADSREAHLPVALADSRSDNGDTELLLPIALGFEQRFFRNRHVGNLLFSSLNCLALVLLTWVLGGCAGYKLGPTGGFVAGERSIQVQPFVNSTMEPRLTEPVTQSLRKQVQQDGTFRLATRGPGDLILKGELLRYDRDPLTLQPGDVFTTRDYQVRLFSKVVLTERSSGRVLVEREVLGQTTVRNVPDLNSAERQASVLIAEDLARNILALAADGSW